MVTPASARITNAKVLIPKHYVKALSYSRVAVDIEAVAAPAGLLVVMLGSLGVLV